MKVKCGLQDELFEPHPDDLCDVPAHAWSTGQYTKLSIGSKTLLEFLARLHFSRHQIELNV